MNSIDQEQQDLHEPERDLKREAEAQLKVWQERIDKQVKRMKPHHDNYKKCRKLVTLSDLRSSHKKNDVKPHLIQSALAALIPSLYAKNPEIEIRPTALAAESEQSEAWQEQARTAEALIQQEFVDNAQLKKNMKACLRSTLTTGCGWLMVTYQSNFETDPIQQNRMNDAQDNVARIDEINRQLNDGQGSKEDLTNELRLQTEHVEAALQGERELYVQQGIVIDRIQSEDIFILDNSVYELGDYVRASAIARRIHMTREDYKTKFHKDITENCRAYKLDGELVRDGSTENDDMMRVYEVWDKSTGKVFTFADGASEWAIAPWAPNPVGERFYPFFEIDFNPVDGEYHPLSDVEMLADIQAEYHLLRTQENQARAKNNPRYGLSRQGDLSAQDATTYIKVLQVPGSDMEWVGFDIPAEQPISNFIQQLPAPQYNQSMWDPSKAFRDLEMATGAGDAARGTINKAKTATEAEIMSMGLQSRMAERQDIIEDAMAEMTRYVLQLFLQVMTPEMVQQSLGASYGWQQAPLEVSFQNLNIDIKAGSMSKPNKFQEREQWMQLMPVLQQSMQQIAQMKQMGMTDMAKCVFEITKELVVRFDERIDLEQFLPNIEANPVEQMAAMMGGQIPQTPNAPLGDEAQAAPPELMSALQGQ